MTTPADTAPEQPDDDAPAQADTPSAPEPSAPIQPAPTVSPTPILPTQSREDTDVGWGDYRERDEDDHLLRDRPPHWDNT